MIGTDRMNDETVLIAAIALLQRKLRQVRMLSTSELEESKRQLREPILPERYTHRKDELQCKGE